MSKAKKYFYLTVIMMILSIYFNLQNPLVHMHFGNVATRIIVCSIVSFITIILAIIFADKSIKHRKAQGLTRKLVKLFPILILLIIIFHIITALFTFGII